MHMGARYYAPDLGRWISPDLAIGESPQGMMAAPLQSNLYAYSLNNPINFLDAAGMAAKDPWYTRVGLRLAGAVEGTAKALLPGGFLVPSSSDDSDFLYGKSDAEMVVGACQLAKAATEVTAGPTLALASGGTLVVPGIAITIDGAVTGAQGVTNIVQSRRTADRARKAAESEGAAARPKETPHPSQRAARRAAEREGGMGKHGERVTETKKLNGNSRAPEGPPGVRTEQFDPASKRTVHHDPYGNHYPDKPSSDVGPHYGVEGPGLDETSHHTYPSNHDPSTNR
jgi:RHS repeat-associated protein